MTNVTFANLRDKPDLVATVADRIWRAWSKDRGLSAENVVQKLESIITSVNEFTLVAHTGDKFAGTISVIKSDMAERPNLTPWIAAVWVEQDFRKQKLGSALVAAAERHAQERGENVLYLYCAPDLRPFYSGLGWKEIESNIGPKRSCVFAKQLLETAPVT